METISNIKWWDTFIKKTNNFTETTVIKNSMSIEFMESLNSAVMVGLRNRILAKDENGLRIYFPEKDVKKEDDAFFKIFFESPPLDNENIVDYCNRVFKEKFGLILNFYERHSEYIAIEIRKIIEPFIEKIGIPATGFDITVFIGNYGWTPLGIHQDHIGENVMHMHLGPGSKKMYTWDEKDYKELTDTKHNNFDIEPLLKHAEEHEFSTGDVFFMPWNKFHIGRADELSVGVTLWFNSPTKIRFFDKIMNTFYTSYIEEDKKEILKPINNYVEDHILFEEFLSNLKKKDFLLDLKVEDFFKYLYNEYKYSLLSNGCWQAAPLSQATMSKYDIENYEFLEDKTIIGTAPFIIYHILNEKDSTISIFVRGSKIDSRFSPEILTIIEILNSHKEVKVVDLINNKESGWPPEAFLYILSMIYDKRGFEIIADE